MKRFFNLFLFLAVVGSLFVGCDSLDSGMTDGETGNEAGMEETPSYHSAYFEEIVFDQSGEYLGLNLGDSRESVMGKLPEDALDDEYEDYVYYYWVLDDLHDYYVDLYFDDTDELESLDAYVYFYDENYDYDVDAAQAFYQDMVDMLTAKYGDGESSDAEDDYGYQYTYWYFEDKDVEVGLDEGEVYFYAYSYDY